MRLNGLFVVANLAVRKLAHPLVTQYESALVLGSLREDVWWIPGARFVLEHLSFSHFYEPGLPGGFIPLLWPGPRMKGDKFYRRAVTEHRAGRTASGFVQLGRVAHLITDMCCPVHAHRAVHDTDPYEWWVEGNKKKLLELEREKDLPSWAVDSKDGWTLFADRIAPTVQYEHTLVATRRGVVITTLAA